MKPTDLRSEIDHQFNPARWTPRISPDDFIPAHVEFSESQSSRFRSELSSAELSTITYAYQDTLQEIDVFRPGNVPEGAPIVVYIHGGWWQWFSKEMFSFIAQPLTQAGLAVYMPAYTLAQNWNGPEAMTRILGQLEHAMLKIFKEADAHGSRQIILVGHSAGGQLVSLMHRTDWEKKYDIPKETVEKVTDVFSLAGLFDLRALTNSYVNDAIGMSEDEAQRLSSACLPVDQARNYPALHLVLPEHDTAEFYRQTKEYHHLMLRTGVDCKMKILPDRDHVSMIEALVRPDDELRGYILQAAR